MGGNEGQGNRGDQPGEMGNALPFVAFGAWPEVTTAAPTTGAPTSIPTYAPVVCDSEDMAEVNWHDMLNEDEDEQRPSLLLSDAVDFKASTLSLTFSASLEY